MATKKRACVVRSSCPSSSRFNRKMEFNYHGSKLFKITVPKIKLHYSKITVILFAVYSIIRSRTARSQVQLHIFIKILSIPLKLLIKEVNLLGASFSRLKPRRKGKTYVLVPCTYLYGPFYKIT